MIMLCYTTDIVSKQKKSGAGTTTAKTTTTTTATNDGSDVDDDEGAVSALSEEMFGVNGEDPTRGDDDGPQYPHPRV